MGTLEYKIQVDLATLLDGVASQINAFVLPTINQAVKAVAAETAYRWRDKVAKAKLWNGEKQPYIESISWLMTGDFSATVHTDYKLAQDIENGRPAYDMKKMLDTSLKVRVSHSKKNSGKRYLIIPFRHNTPGQNALAPDMPTDIYKKARRLDASQVMSTTTRPSGTGAFALKTKKAISVPQQNYKWGDKLRAGLAPKLKDYHAADPYAGMVKMKTSAGKANSSAYLTFRVMMEGSPKWIVPARAGLYLAKQVRDEIAIEAPKVFEQAIKYLK